jgi:ParB-like chromosome segregation protein Spo0J
VVGHGWLLAARQLGLDTVPVYVAAGLTTEQIRLYRLADYPWSIELLEADLMTKHV